MECPDFGLINSDKAKFCHACGTPIQRVPPRTSRSIPSPSDSSDEGQEQSVVEHGESLALAQDRQKGESPTLGEYTASAAESEKKVAKKKVAKKTAANIKTCRYCKEVVKPDATLCPHCRKNIGPGSGLQAFGFEAIKLGCGLTLLGPVVLLFILFVVSC